MKCPCCGNEMEDGKLRSKGGGFFLPNGEKLPKLYKRFESGRFQLPCSETEARELTPQQYRWLMEGLQIDQPKAHRPVTGLTVL